MPFLGPDPDFPLLVSGSVETADPALARAEDDVGAHHQVDGARAPDAAAHGLHLDDHRERQNAVEVLTRSQDGRPGVDTAGVE